MNKYFRVFGFPWPKTFSSTTVQCVGQDYLRTINKFSMLSCSSSHPSRSLHLNRDSLNLCKTYQSIRSIQYGAINGCNIRRGYIALTGLNGCRRNNSIIMHIMKNHFSQSSQRRKQTGSIVMYIIAAGVFMVGAAYAGVPLYRMFCQSTGLGGEVQSGHDSTKVESMKSMKDRVLKIRFNADIASSMQWNFRPHQSEIKVVPGETALAFYKAKNPTDVPVIGISTYNVVPFEAAPYFNKIQCFCFEEQRLNPQEEVDLPVFFYIDPEFCDDPKLEHVSIITLSYTFFEAKEGMTLPTFNYSQPAHSYAR